MAYHGTELSRLRDELTQYRDLYTNSEQRCANLQAQLTDLLEELEAKAP
ncbi:MAG: hypothetical protein V2I33_18365 [Kangiellaceae bacterium]|jgi:hypothetical protein|nr:hypothetical protein [Kangiellaceae bacterium]